MTSYPAAIDGPSTLYTPADAFSTKPLETTATVAIGAGDSTISVVATTGGFVDAYGVLSIDDELVIYTARSGVQFTGCQRGAFGTAAASHANGVTVRANMVAGFITALQSAVVAIETELGTAAARNYVQKNGAVTITGVKTFQDGVAFGTGNIAGTGLVRLPNLGAVKWRKADNSGDLGMALNASNHVAMDAVIDFAAGQTFGAFSYPDASTTAKGIVQIDRGRRAGRRGRSGRARQHRRYSWHLYEGSQSIRRAASPLARRWWPATFRPTPTWPAISFPARCRSRSRTMGRRWATGAR